MIHLSRPGLLLSLLSLSIFVMAGPIFADPAPFKCAKSLKKSVPVGRGEFEKLGGVNVRLLFLHGDGFGDMMNAVSLAEEIQKKWPTTPVSVILDDSAAIKALEARFPEFKKHRRIHGVEVVWAGTPRAEEIDSRPVTIWRVPADSSRIRRGHSAFNIYLEEPGADDSSFKLLSDLKRGRISADEEGRYHLRLSPGFGLERIGVTLPSEEKPKLVGRDRLLAELRAKSGLELPGASKAKWALAYHHGSMGSRGKDYFAGLAKGLLKAKVKDPVYIFDFSRNPPEPHAPMAFWGFGPASDAQFNHIFPDGRRTEGYIGIGRRSPYTIVHVGPQSHELYQQFLLQSDLPVLVTGTQSLFEAIAWRIPFYYDLLPWKTGLAIGLVDHAVTHFEEKDACFLVGVLIGDLCFPFEKIRASYDSGEGWLWTITEQRRSAAFAQLVSSPEKQEIFKRFEQSLQSENSLLEHLNEVAARFRKLSSPAP